MYTVRTFESEQAARRYRADHGTGGLIFIPDAPAQEVILRPPEVTQSDARLHPLVRDRRGEFVPDETEPGSDAWYRIRARELFEVDGLIEIPLYAEVERDEQNGAQRAWVTARVWVADGSTWALARQFANSGREVPATPLTRVVATPEAAPADDPPGQPAE